nr:uncharacterized protein C1orf109 homolog isoform X2 [Equus asinus]
MAQDQPLLAVQEALRKCFPVVEEQQGLWQSTLRDCQPLLASLGNLAEQLQAAQRLRFEDVPALRAFPDLKERLRRKQLAAGDTVLDKLGERLAVLLKVRDTVSSHVERVLQIYEQHADTISIDAVLQASAVSPSVADMLEWLQDIERHYRNSYPLHAFPIVARAVPGGPFYKATDYRLCSVGQFSLVPPSYSPSSGPLLSYAFQALFQVLRDTR